MNDIIFGDFETTIINELRKAKKDVKIAVAWLNLPLYANIFNFLLSKNVKLSIIVNSDYRNINKNTIEVCNTLKSKGAFIKYIKMPTPNQYMHHKFCIIDDKVVLIGSYNWTINASKNFEDLLYIDSSNVIDKLNNEFIFLANITDKDIYDLQNFNKCTNCKDKLINIAVIDVNIDKYSMSKYTIFEICSCGIKEVYSDFLEGAFYFSLCGLKEQYSDRIEECLAFGESIDGITERYDYEVEQLIFRAFGNRFCIRIHGVGVYNYEITESDGGGEYVTNILWKSRFAEKYIQDRYCDFEM